MNEVNNPNGYKNTSKEVQNKLQQWIEENVSPYKTKTFASQTSYYLKHSFTNATGIYVTNGEMKGALLAAGFEPKDVNHINWVFKFSKKVGVLQC